MAILRTRSYNDDSDDTSIRKVRVRKATPPVSLRLPEAMAEKVRRIAALEHRSFAETVKVLAEEAIKLREFPEITFTIGATGRRATFRHGPDVWEILEPYILGDKDWRVLRESYPDLDESMLRTAVRYYETYPNEIEARIGLNQGP
jgi:uncharacterized protein (DUF433 family)